MTDYSPPLDDIKFVLRTIGAVDEIVQFPEFNHAEPDLIDGLLDEAARFMREVVAPTNRIGDETGANRNEDGTVTVPEEMVRAYEQYVAAGWNAVKADSEYGGHGFPGVVALAIQEMLSSANMSFSLCPMLTMSAILALEKHGSDELRATYLPKLVSGEWSGTMVLSEPEAGSDVGALRTRAEPSDDGSWRIFGTKIFITWGEHEMAENIVHLVLARVPEAPPGTKGISLFLVPKYLVDEAGNPGVMNDVACVSIEHKLGIHASPTCVMAFGENDGAVGHLIGEPNQGMRYMFTMMNDARLHVGMEGLANSVRAFQLAASHAKERRQGRAIGAPTTESSPIIAHPDVRRMLLTMQANIDAMRGLLFDTARSLDIAEHHPDGEVREAAAARASLLTPVAKAWPTDLGVEMASIGVQVHGGMGFVEETGAAQFYRDARIAPIYEGTNGIQAIDLVLRKLPLDNGAVVHGYIDEIEAVAKQLTSSPNGLGEMGGQLAEGAALLRNATDWLLSRSDPNDALAGATPYLKLFGTVAGGAYTAQLALAASADLADTAGDPEFLQAKIAVARFFCGQLLPEAFGLVAAVTAGAEPLYSVPESQLGP